MPQGEEPPRRPRMPPQPYAETVIDADDVDRQNAGHQPQPPPVRSRVSNVEQPVHDAPPPGQAENSSNTGFGNAGGQGGVNAAGGAAISTPSVPRVGPKGLGRRSREGAMHTHVAATVNQNGRPRPSTAQNNAIPNSPGTRNRFQNQRQRRSQHAPVFVRGAQESRRSNPPHRDIVTDLYDLFRNADYTNEEEPEFQLLNGHRLRGMTREAYDELPIEDQVAVRPHLRGRFLLSTRMSQEEVNVAVEMEMAGEDEMDIEAMICSMRAAADEGW